MTLRPLSRQLAFAWGAATAAGLAALPWAARFASELPACPLRSATGWPCPACGSGRAVLALSEGHLGAALLLNPLAVVGGGAFVVLGLAAAIGALRDRPLAEPRELPLWARLTVPAAFAAQWLYLLAVGR